MILSEKYNRYPPWSGNEEKKLKWHLLCLFFLKWWQETCNIVFSFLFC